MKTYLILVLSVVCLFDSVEARSSRINESDMPIFFSLVETLDSNSPFIKGQIYEITDNWRKPIAGYGNGNDVVVRYSGRRVLIRPYRKQYAEGELVQGNYFKCIGTEKYSESKIAQEVPLPLLAECSPSEAEKFDAYKEQLTEEIAQREYESRRQASVNSALKGIEEITEDEKVIDDAYNKATAIYDEAYEKAQSFSDADKITREFGKRIIHTLKEEEERKQREWDEAHPEEAAARREEERLRLEKLEKEKREAETKKTRQILSRIAESIKTYAKQNPRHPKPNSFDQLVQRLGAMVIPPYDAWNRRLEFVDDGMLIKIISSGPDGVKGTADDLGENVDLGASCAGQNSFGQLLMELSAYEGSFIPGVFGFRFGEQLDRKYGCFAGVISVRLPKPFRGIEEAELTYEGQYSPRLVGVRLVGFPNGTSSEDECLKIISILDKNYKIKIPKSVARGFVRAEFQKDRFALSVRNDTCVTPEGELAYVVEFRDNRLSDLIQRADEAFSRSAKSAIRPPVEPPPAVSVDKEKTSEDEEDLGALNM